jgi:hypothetical protein
MHTYVLSAAGRRTALILLVAAIIIWGFAIWLFRSTLGASSDPNVGFFDALTANLNQGLSVSQIVPALLALVLIIATPLVIWNIFEEWDAHYTITDDGLQFASLGIRLTYPWQSIQSIRNADNDGDEPFSTLQLNADHTRQIANPLLRFLHRQAFGRRQLQIYPGIQDRDQLLADIRSRANLDPAQSTEAHEATV